jgi:anti-anti-sigma regulatory factor
MTVTSLTLADLVAGDARARLSSLLSPRATVVVACQDVPRLPVGVLAVALELTAATGGFLRLEGLTPTTRLALQMIDPERRLAMDDAQRATQVGERPYQVRLGADGKVTLLLGKGIGQHPHMNEAASYEWIRGLEASAVEVDLSNIEHLNSLLVAWLLQLNQGAGAGRCRLVQVGRQAVAQLTQLRLNHLLSIG